MRISTLTAVALAQLVSAATYDLKSYAAGDSFVDAFYFIGGYNATINGEMWNWWNSGDDFLANVTTAKQRGMLSVDSTTGNVKLSVDTVPKVDYNQKRFSFRLESRKKYGFGTVFVFDAVHMPYGCGMWPAYWTTGESWPHGGEIDIMEQVNKRTNNQMVFHTDGQCILAPAEGSISGNVVLNDCMHKPDDNAGCATQDPRNTSFGDGFNSAQGGIYVTEFTETAISIWFFPRANIPAGLDTKSNATTIDTATFGQPATQLPSNAGCDIKSQFAEQKIIINTSLCGNFAGEPDVLNASGCAVPTGQTCYSSYVTGDAATADFSQAYFEIVSHRIFQTSAATSSDSPPGGPAETTTSGGGGSGNSGTTGGSSSTSGNTPGSTSTPGGGASSTQVARGLLVLATAFVGVFLL